MAEGKHPVPSRTRKLSPPAPMVLPGKLGGRVGRRRDTQTRSAAERRRFWCFRASVTTAAGCWPGGCAVSWGVEAGCARERSRRPTGGRQDGAPELGWRSPGRPGAGPPSRALLGRRRSPRRCRPAEPRRPGQGLEGPCRPGRPLIGPCRPSGRPLIGPCGPGEPQGGAPEVRRRPRAGPPGCRRRRGPWLGDPGCRRRAGLGDPGSRGWAGLGHAGSRGWAGLGHPRLGHPRLRGTRVRAGGSPRRSPGPRPR
jgi:hypothetical protein